MVALLDSCRHLRMTLLSHNRVIICRKVKILVSFAPKPRAEAFPEYYTDALPDCYITALRDHQGEAKPD